jgi:putative FmdB family regulatory protein
MPIYEYRRPDGTTFEVLQSFSDPPLSEDPETGVPVKRVLHAPAVHFKGKGFYNTDYGTRRRKREEDGASKAQDKSEKSEKPEAKKDEPAKKDNSAKPAAAAAAG